MGTIYHKQRATATSFCRTTTSPMSGTPKPLGFKADVLAAHSVHGLVRVFELRRRTDDPIKPLRSVREKCFSDHGMVGLSDEIRKGQPLE